MKADPQATPPVIPSLIFLGVDVALYGGFAVYTLLARRSLLKIIESRDIRALTPAAELFIATPGSIYAAVFLLFVAGLLVKEVAIDRKEVTLRLNLVALGIMTVLICLYWISVRIPIGEAPPRLSEP